MKIADRIWPVTRNVMKGHTLVYRATNGLIGHGLPGAPPTTGPLATASPVTPK